MTSSPTAKSGRVSSPLGPWRKPSTTSPVAGPPSIPSTTSMRTFGVDGSTSGSTSTIRPRTSWTGGSPVGRGVMSGTRTKSTSSRAAPTISARACRRSPTKGTSGAQSGSVTSRRSGRRRGRSVVRSARSARSLSARRCASTRRLEGVPAQADEDDRPAVDRLERGGMDDPGPAGDRLQAPAPLALEAGSGHAQAEDRFGPRLEALHVGVLAQQPEPRASGPGGRGRRPRRRRGSEPELREEDRGRCRVVQGRPDGPWRRLDEDPPLDQAIARAGGRPDGESRPLGQDGRPSLRSRSGATPSSSRGRRRSIRGARWPGRRASRSEPRRRWWRGATGA